MTISVQDSVLTLLLQGSSLAKIQERTGASTSLIIQTAQGYTNSSYAVTSPAQRVTDFLSVGYTPAEIEYLTDVPMATIAVYAAENLTPTSGIGIGGGGTTTSLATGATVSGATASSLLVTDSSGKLQSGPSSQSVTNVLSVAPRNDRGIYVPAGWGQSWFPKLAAAQAGTGLARVAYAGHSIIRGYYASRLGKGWSGLLTALLQEGADGGSGFQTVGDSSAAMVPALTTSEAAYYDTTGTGDFISTTGTWVRENTGIGASEVQIYPTTAGATLACKGRGTKCRIFALGGLQGDVYAVYIDGVAQGFINTYAPIAQVLEFDITGLAAGSHQCVLTYQGSTSNIAPIIGIAFENATGVVCDQYAVGGASSTVLATTQVALWNGGPSNPADLIIVADEANDLSANMTAATWCRNIHLFFDVVRGNKGGNNGSAYGATDLLLVFCNPGLFDTTNLAAEYVAEARTMCEHYGAAFVDLQALGRNSYDYWTELGYWGQGPTSPGPSAPPNNGDKGHMSDIGHLYSANVIAPIISGVTTATVPSAGLPAGGNTLGAAAPATVPAQVTEVTVLQNSTQVALAWKPAGGGAITDYTVQYRVTGSGSWTTWAHTASPLATQTITGLTTGTSYDFQVAAVTAAGTGPFSSIVTTTTTYVAPADNFTRANTALSTDGYTLGTTSTGGNSWTILQAASNNALSQWQIYNNNLRQVGGVLANPALTCESFCVVDSQNANGTVQVTLVDALTGVSGTGPDPGVVFRCSDYKDLWMVWADYGIFYKLMKLVSGAYTTVVTSTRVPAAGDVVKVIYNGSAITVYVNGTSIMTATDTFNDTATKVGVRASDATSSTVGALVGGTTSDYSAFSYSTATS